MHPHAHSFSSTVSSPKFSLSASLSDLKASSALLWHQGHRKDFYSLLQLSQRDKKFNDLSLGFSPLHHCAIENDIDRCKSILQNIVDLRSMSPATSSSSCVSEFEDELLQSQLDISVPDTEFSDSTENTLAHDIPPLVEPDSIHTSHFWRGRHHDALNSLNLLQKSNISKQMAVNVVDDNLATPLHHAASLGNIEIVEMLLDKGANPNSGDNTGRTPLFIAACDNQPDVVKLLVKRGADIDLGNKDRVTALASALFRENLEMVQLLHDLGADLTAVWACGCTALLHSAIEGKLEAVRVLIELDVDIHYGDRKNGMTALHLAALRGHLEIVKLLIKNGASPNVPSFDMLTPLHNAASNNHVEVLKYLCEVGGDVGACTVNEHLTPLHYSSKRGYVESSKYLLEMGADVNAQSTSSSLTFDVPLPDWSPLHLAARRGHLNVVKLLLDYNADVDCLGGSNLTTPLQQACKRCHVEIIELLVEKGARYDFADRIQRLPITRVLTYPIVDSNSQEQILRASDLLFWCGKENASYVEKLRGVWTKAAERGHDKFCLRALIRNDGRLVVSKYPNAFEADILFRYNRMMYKWILKTSNSLTLSLLPELYEQVESFLGYC
ncbi:hypothetical protein HK098_008019 [Nowakowskiella sp. JEL0407]|nr:hypothetical protein HK098_008019 [Nowakowskiella sp. JEL0407]